MSDKANTVSKQLGMGAIVNAKGVTFRVWAPNAEKVCVTGTFNDWNETATPLFGRKERLLVDVGVRGQSRR